jgi:pyruvate kinase
MPTRAEITDVANAVFESSDAIMLSGETTVGKYPVKCIEVFDRIAKRIERSGNAQFHVDAELTSPRQMLVKSAVVMADDLKAAAILVFTIRGHMARYTAWMRPRYSPIFAFCEKWETADSLSINWGVRPFVIHFNYDSPEKTIDTAIALMIEQGHLKRGQTTVIISAISTGEQIVDAVQMRVI